MIYHYTSLDTLELILESKKLRFGRLDNVDDKAESEPYKYKQIADKIFVSCWTEDQIENITLWKMYGDDFKGVRIGLKKPFFKLKSIPQKDWNGLKFINPTNKKILFLPEECFTKEYFIVPSYLTDNTFYKKIEYINYDELEGKYNKITKTESTDGVNYTVSLDFAEIAQYKSNEWETQKETRYVLGIIPISRDLTSNVNFNNHEYISDLTSEIIHSILNEKKLAFRYFDLELSVNSLLDMEIIAGPKSDFERIQNINTKFRLKTKPIKSVLKVK